MPIRGLTFAVLMATAIASGAHAADPARPPDGPGVKDGIVGADVTSDKNRSGPDGWSWAPNTRDQSFSGQAPGESKTSVHDTPSAKADASPKTLAPGDDPGTPATSAPSMAGKTATSH